MIGILLAVLTVSFNGRNGGVDVLRLSDDGDGMNWAEGTGTWGTLLGYSIQSDWDNGTDNVRRQPFFACTGIETNTGGIVARYALDDLRVDVARQVVNGELVEQYDIRNAGRVPRYFLRGHLGILTTFNDSYATADKCMVQRCDAHVFTGGEVSWVHAVKMGPHPTELLLTLEEGALDGYSVRRIRKRNSNDRGDIVLHPAPFTLLAGETKRIRWRVRAIAKGSFRPPVQFKYETVFPDEQFEVEVEGRMRRFPAGKAGEERIFDFKLANGRTCRARGFTSRPFEEIMSDRAHFIVRNQQCLDPKSPLYGAVLPYSNVERRMYYDAGFSDHNACRERIGIGVFLAEWAKDHPDDAEIAAAVKRYEDFVLRELFDPDTGATYNEVGRDPKVRRLYNAPGVIRLFAAFHELNGDARYLDWIERMIRNHYANGGDRFYANGCLFAQTVRKLADDGRKVDDLQAAVRRHAENIFRNGLNYPVHEVNFEQTIVAPAAMILLDWCQNFGRDSRYMDQLRQHLDVLTRFDGDQPSYLQGGTSLRHWDGYWFGGDMLYGDTLQHLTVCSSRVYWMWYRLTGDEEYRHRAIRGMRNLLCLFHDDGTASACYFQPLSVTYLAPDGTQLEPTRMGEHFDPWSNDQDNLLGTSYPLGWWKQPLAAERVQ